MCPGERECCLLRVQKARKIFRLRPPGTPRTPAIQHLRVFVGPARTWVKRSSALAASLAQLSDSANKLIRCWHRGVVVRGDCCVFRPQSSAAASSSPQRCSSTMGSHGSPLRSHSRLASIAASCNRAPEDGIINSTRWENSSDGGIRRRRQAGRQISCRRRFAHGGRHGSCLHCVAAAPPRRQVTPASRLPGGAHGKGKFDQTFYSTLGLANPG